MKSILILGAGNAQTDAINLCKKMGYTVLGCSYTNTDKGIPLLDGFKQIDIKDIDGVAAYADESGVSAVYSAGSDLAVPTAMKVSEKLNLPHFISYETAQICQSKVKLREYLGRDFVGNIPFVKAQTLEQALTFDSFPAMMKPSDSQGQRGCFEVYSRQDIEEHFQASYDYSPSGNVIVEKYINGQEYSVNLFMQNGNIDFFLLSGRNVFTQFPGGIIKSHLIPADVSKQEEDKVYDLVKRTVQKLGIKDGPVYFQLKIDEKTKTPWLIEVTPRLDGCHMWNAIKHYCGVDLLSATFERLLEGKTTQFNPQVLHDKIKLEFTCEKTGELFDRSRYNVSDALYLCWYYQTGEKVKKLNGFMEKGGYFITDKF